MNKIFLLLFVLFFNSCDAQDKKDITFKDFPVEQALTTKKLFIADIASPYHMMLFNDSLLLIRHDESTTRHHFSSYSLSSKRKLRDLLPAGRKAGESLSFLSFGILGDQLWVLDLLKAAIIFVSIKDLDSVTEELPFQNTNYYRIQPLAKHTFICSGDHDSNYLLEKVDLNKGKIEETYFPYPENFPRTQKEAFESFLYKHPTQNMYFLAARYADYLQYIDLDAGTKKQIFGPEGFGPNLKLAKTAEGKEFMSINKETRFGYVRGQTTEKYIYLLISGNFREMEHAELGKTIVVFDWDGNEKKRINLENGIVDFVVSSDDSTIYVFNPQTRSIESGNLY
jgi:hypothetical protein